MKTVGNINRSNIGHGNTKAGKEFREIKQYVGGNNREIFESKNLAAKIWKAIVENNKKGGAAWQIFTLYIRKLGTESGKRNITIISTNMDNLEAAEL